MGFSVCFSYSFSHLVFHFNQALQLYLSPTFSSTTKRSLQPHDDKLLIGGQQFLIRVYVFCACCFPTLIDSDFRTVVFVTMYYHSYFN